MKNLLLLAVVTSVCVSDAFSQVVLPYQRVAFPGTYSSITGATGPLGDDNALNVSLPFTFTYDGHAYTQARICTNGWLELGSSQRPLSFSYSLSNSDLFMSTEPNKTLAPWWDDLATGSGTILYTTLGTSPNRVFAVEWKNVVSYYTGGKILNFQVRLYESTGVIEFWYGSATGTASSSESASFGIEDHIGGSGHFIDGPTGSRTTGTVNLTTSNWPSTFYRFSPAPLILSRPVGGERFYIGLTDTIRWYSTGVSQVKLDYSTDAGSTWSAITSSTGAASGFYAWPVPDAPTTEAKIRITDVDDTSKADSTAGVFTILLPPSISVSPDSLAFALNEGDSDDATVTIVNAGPGSLHFEISPTYSTSSAASAPSQSAISSWTIFPPGVVPGNNSMQKDAPKPASTPNSLAAAATLPLILTDPAGDGGSVDVSQLRGEVASGNLTLQLLFHSWLGASNFGGYIGIDADQNPSTGMSLPAGMFSQTVGCEYVLSLFELWNGYVVLYDSTFIYITTLPATIDVAGFTFSTPMTFLGNDDGVMNVAGVVGSSSGPTDWFPDVGFGTVGGNWISVNPGEGDVASGDDLNVMVTIRTGELSGGEFTASLIVEHDDPLKPRISIPVRLTVFPNPNLAVADSLVFVRTNIGYPDTLFLTLLNNGSDPLSIDSLTISNPVFSALGATSFNIEPDQQRQLGIVFDPSTPGEYAGTLTIKSNDPDSTAVVQLFGVADYPPVIGIQPAAISITLPERDTASTILTISNSGTGSLLWRWGDNITVSRRSTTLSEQTLVPSAVNVDEQGLSTQRVEETTVRQVASVTTDMGDLTGKQVGFVGFSLSGYNVIAADLAARGATVRPLNPPITDTALARFDVVAIDDWVSSLSIQEIDLLRAWLRAGRGLLVQADNQISMTYVNQLLSGTGISAVSLNTFFDGTFTNIARHPITAGVDTILAIAYGAYFTTDLPVQDLVLDDAGRRHAVASYLGSGRVVAVGNEVTGDFNIFGFDTRLFSNQIFDWLASFDFVSLEPASGTVAPGDSQYVTVKIDGTELVAGDYETTVVISSNDPLLKRKSIPVDAHLLAVPNLVVADTVLLEKISYVGYPDTIGVLLRSTGSEHVVVLSMSVDNEEFSVLGLTLFAVPSGTTRLAKIQLNATSPGGKSALLSIVSNDPDSLTTVRILATAVHPPQIVVTPDSFSVALTAGDTADIPMSLSNSDGLGPLYFDIRDRQESFGPPPPPSARVYAAAPQSVNQSSLGSLNLKEMAFRHRTTMQTPTQPTLSSAIALVAPPLPTILEDTPGDAFADILEIKGFVENANLWMGMRFAAGVSVDSTTGLFALDVDRNPNTGLLDPVLGGLGADRLVYFNRTFLGDSAVVYDRFFNVVGWGGMEFRSTEAIVGIPLTVLGALPSDMDFVSFAFGMFAPEDRAPDTSYATVYADAPWLTAIPDTGTVDAGGTGQVSLRVITNDLLGGEYRAKVRVMNNDPAQRVVERSFVLHLTGIPQIAVASDSIDFGTVYLGKNKRIDLMISNPGSDVLTGSVASSDSAFVLLDSAFVIPPRENKFIRIVFQPRASGALAATGTVTSNAGSPLTVVLKGTGAVGPRLVASRSSFSFSSNTADSIKTSFTIRNAGEVPLVVAISDENVSSPQGSVVSGGYLYGAIEYAIHKIDIQTKTLAAVLTSPVFISGPNGMAFADSSLYLNNGTTILVLNPETGAIRRTFTISDPLAYIDGLAVVNEKLYALNYGNSSIHVVNPSSGAIETTLYPPVSIIGGMDGANGRLFVTGGNFVYEINPETGAVIRSLNVGFQYFGVAFTGERLFVGGVHNNYVIELNADTGARLDSIQVSSYWAMAAGGPQDAPWLVESPVNLTLAGGDSAAVQVVVIPPQRQSGRYRANIVLQSNDADSSTIRIPVTIDVTTGIAEDQSLPVDFSLSQNFPNPFNPTTTIRYDIPTPSRVELVIFNLLGERIVRVVNQDADPGRYAVTWQGRDEADVPVPSGVYFYRITATALDRKNGKDFVQTKKLVVLK